MSVHLSGIRPEMDDGYRPTSILCVLSLCTGCVSLVAVLTLAGVPFALGAIVLGVVAMLTVRRSCGERTGLIYAKAGTLIGLIAVIGGVSLHAYHHRLEVPAGYRQVSFDRGISTRRATTQERRVALHPDVEKLVGVNVSLRGYIWPDSHSNGQSVFVLTSKGFGYREQIDGNDVIIVELQPGQSVEYTDACVSVAGEFAVLDSASLENCIYILKNAEIRSVTSPFGSFPPGGGGDC